MLCLTSREIWGSLFFRYVVKLSLSMLSILSRVSVRKSVYCVHSSCALTDASLIAIFKLFKEAWWEFCLNLLTVWGLRDSFCGGLMSREFGTILPFRHFRRKVTHAFALSFFTNFLTTKHVSFFCCCCAPMSDVSLWWYAILADGMRFKLKALGGISKSRATCFNMFLYVGCGSLRSLLYMTEISSSSLACQVNDSTELRIMVRMENYFS